MTTHGPLIAISSPYAPQGRTVDHVQADYGPQGDPRILVAHAASTVTRSDAAAGRHRPPRTAGDPSVRPGQI